MTDLDPRITETLTAAGVTAPTDRDIAWAIGKIEMEMGIKLPMPAGAMKADTAGRRKAAAHERRMSRGESRIDRNFHRDGPRSSRSF